MSVVMKGGNSGSRGKDYLPQVPSAGSPQPVLNTAGGSKPPGVYFQAENFERQHAQTATFEVPLGGTIPEGSSDICQQDIEGIKP